jgi:hypothetical protein
MACADYIACVLIYNAPVQICMTKVAVQMLLQVIYNMVMPGCASQVMPGCFPGLT